MVKKIPPKTEKLFDPDLLSQAVSQLRRRQQAGLRDAARQVGISPATLHRIENGATPDMETFLKVCRWLGRKPGNFLPL